MILGLILRLILESRKCDIDLVLHNHNVTIVIYLKLLFDF